MKTYQVQVKNHYVTSIKMRVVAASEFDAALKARAIFKFDGHSKSITIEELDA